MASRFQFALPDPRPRDGWFRVGNLDITTTALLVITGAASMFLFALSTQVFNQLVFDPVLVRDGELWRLITWPIANAPGIWAVLALFFFWNVGHFVEEMLGRRRYAILLVVVTIVPGLLVSLLDPSTFRSIDEVGVGLLLTVTFVVLAAENPQAPGFFGVPIWVLAVVFVGINILQLSGLRLWGTLVMTVVAVALGLVVVRQWGFAERLSFIPNLGAAKPNPPRRGPAPPRAKRGADRRRSSQVVEGPWSAPAPPRPSPDAAAAQAELDSLLDKISAGGLDSLTSDEKRRLNELSKRLR